MFGLAKPRLPITPEQQRWVDSNFLRLAGLLGARRLLQATVVLPTPEHFPDPYDRSEAALQRIFTRVATRMQVNPSDDDPDMEPMNDLLTVFLGLGIFTANAAFHFKQYTTNRSQGWSAGRLGYLSEEQYGYALARFAFERGEARPAWRKFLSTNVSAYWKRSAAWLADRNEPRLLS